ncbi:hypothetical protein AAY473_014351 [Plecturocebus cupreus]
MQLVLRICGFRIRRFNQLWMENIHKKIHTFPRSKTFEYYAESIGFLPDPNCPTHFPPSPPAISPGLLLLPAEAVLRVQGVKPLERACATMANFVFLVETGFHHVGQDGLDLLTS